jgi:general stress protein 26
VTVEIWHRPWARFAPHRRQALHPGEVALPHGHAASVWLYHLRGTPPVLDGRPAPDIAEPAAQMQQRTADGADQVATQLSLLPFPVRRRPGVQVGQIGAARSLILWPDAPERPPEEHEPTTEEELRAQSLMLRVLAVWDRIEDVRDALTDPVNLWQTLRARWLSQGTEPPRMDVIVVHAKEVAQALDRIESAPRRILRRVHRLVPVARVQEIDRRAMLWLARQPGEGLAERAGDDQRLLAVAREENFDTLENRVLRAYCELAARHARDYLDRNRSRRQTRRARLVEGFGKRCRRIARDLSARGVRRAEPGVTPNFVLQQNPTYHRIWTAWAELRNHKRERDELWRWQSRSWEEFSALALVVALMQLKGAKVVAAAPLWFRDEHLRGRWIEADTPLAVVHLPGRGLIVELQTKPAGVALGNLGAPLWLRVGRLDDEQAILQRVAVWPLWAPNGGLVEGEAAELSRVLTAAGGTVGAGLAIRPAATPDRAEFDVSGGAMALALGTEGPALSEALWTMASFVEDLLSDGIAA